jgi:formylglycine-generating enzyme required for sulfatase activity
MEVKKMKKVWSMFLLIIVLFFFNFNRGVIGEEPGAEKHPASPFLEPQLVLIPAGKFVMGKELPPAKQGEKKEYVNNPAHNVELDSFYIDKYEITNYQYFLFCQATGKKLPVFWGMNEFHCGLDFPNHPVVGVSHLDALDYAKWRGMRLPTEAEWEYAARGGLIGKKYPNGDEPDDKLVNYGQHQRGTTAVGSYPANGFGLHDMAGNVREWVSDYYQTDYYLKTPGKNPQGPDIGRFRVIRGGSWFAGPGCVTVYRRNALAPNWVDFAVGFRCVKDAEPEKQEKNNE